jgi:hypothetical protein
LIQINKLLHFWATFAYPTAGKTAEHVPAKLTMFWRILSTRSLFEKKPSELGKIAEIAIVHDKSLRTQ